MKTTNACVVTAFVEEINAADGTKFLVFQLAHSRTFLELTADQTRNRRLSRERAIYNAAQVCDE